MVLARGAKKGRREKRRGEGTARVYRPPRPRLSFSDFIDIMAITYFRDWANRLVKTFELDKAIRRAGIRSYPQMYAARILLFTVASAGFAIYFTLLLAFTGLPLVLKLIVSILLLLTPLFVFAIGLAYPSMKVSERKNGVETELPFFAAYLTTMARSGVPVSKVMERVAKLRIFKAMREEARRVLRDISIFGKDPLEALEANALDHPSPTYRDFILGYVTSVRTGGDVLHYLEIRTQDIFARRISELKLIAERMSMFTEVYVTIAVIMTLVFYIFFTISSIFPAAGGFGGLGGMVLFSFVLLPLLTVMLLYMIHASQPKTPIAITSPYRALFFWGIPLAVAVFPMLFFMTGTHQLLQGAPLTKARIIGLTATLAFTLVALSLPTAVVYLIEKRRLRGIGRATAAFLRDLAEIRKTGLSPEKSIILTATRDYGPLNKILKRVASALTLGLDVERALRRALRGIKSWILLANMRFLADSIVVGGGSPETLDSLARYAHNLVELEEELKRRLRSYIFMPYMGAILVATSSLLVLGFTAQATAGQGPLPTLAAAPPVDLNQIALILSIGAVFNAWLMGLVAGKIQDSYLAAGFVHAIILTIVTFLATVITMNTIQLT